jgi:hypothetical protein
MEETAVLQKCWKNKSPDRTFFLHRMRIIILMV